MIPPHVYDITFGWDPGPEIERLLFCCREAGIEPRSALELGCGTGRLLRAIEQRVPVVAGLDLSPDMVAYARAQSAHPEDIILADMSDFSLGRTFDLVFTSANTLRCVTDAVVIERMWRCIAAHLRPGGVFVADLEIGFAAEADSVGRPIGWTLSRGETPGPENSIGKLVGAKKTQDVAAFCIELLGMAGISYEEHGGDFIQGYLGAPGGRIAGGTDEVMLNIIAERVLGLPQDIRVDKGIPFKDIPTGPPS